MPGSRTTSMVAAIAASFYLATAAIGQESPADLVRKTVQNEVSASASGAKFMFQDHKESAAGSQTKLMVETREAMAGMLIALNGRPLGPRQRKDEEARIDRFVRNTGELKKKQKQEKEDSERVMRIVRALPDAFLYERDGSEAATEFTGKAGDQLVRLKFRPNPDYDPPSQVERVLTGMQGVLLVDENRHRIAKIDGTLFKEVGFGWGILGHLDKGGKFLVQQADVGDRHWEVTRMNLDFTGKVLLFKSLNIKSNETFTDFHPAPANLTFKEGVELLRKQHEEMANNNHASKQSGKGSKAQLEKPSLR